MCDPVESTVAFYHLNGASEPYFKQKFDGMHCGYYASAFGQSDDVFYLSTEGRDAEPYEIVKYVKKGK